MNLHPFLFAIFPSLFIFSHNLLEVTQEEIYLPMLLSVLLSCGIWFFWIICIKSVKKAAILASLFVVLLFSYVHFYNFLKYILSQKAHLIKHENILIILISFYTFVSCLIIRSRKDFRNFTKIMNVISIFLVVMQIAQVIFIKNNWKGQAQVNINYQGHSGKSGIPPNIYYLILDGYARGDVLAELYGFDNNEFYQYLKKKGFYVAERSCSNYAQTVLSLASSLNLDYLDKLITNLNTESADRSPAYNALRQNQVFKLLKNQGYKIIVIASGYHLTEIKEGADIYLDFGYQPNQILNTLWDSSPLLLFCSLPEKWSQYYLHRKRILSAFGYLQEVRQLQAPFFIFAHILCPHPPFVFDRSGGNLNQHAAFSFNDGSALIGDGGLGRLQYVQEYKDQLEFINEKLKNAIEAILAQSFLPTVIIIQADHGPGSMLDWASAGNTNLNERMRILNAYYFSDNDYRDLFPEITPVNTFRAVFNHFFDAAYDQLPQKVYFSTWERPFKFIDVTDKVQSE